LFCVIGRYFVMIFHGLVSSGMFMMLYFFYVRFHSRSILFRKNVLGSVPLLRGWCFLLVILNMRVPPSLGFFSEVLLLGLLALWFFFCSVILFFMSFFVGAYNVILFCFSRHGVGNSMRLFMELETREHLLFLLHTFPCFGLIFFSWSVYDYFFLGLLSLWKMLNCGFKDFTGSLLFMFSLVGFFWMLSHLFTLVLFLVLDRMRGILLEFFFVWLFWY